MSKWSPDIYDKAWQFATLAHQEQSYGGRTKGVSINYINHIGSVAMEVINAIQITDLELDANLSIQCALLHDIIEDTRFTFKDIKKEFGEKVANGVLALTKNESLPSKDVMMIDSLDRIKEQPYEVWMVKMADRICNLYHPPFYWNNEKIIAYQKEALLIYETLKEANNILALRLKMKINDYSSFIKN